MIDTDKYEGHTEGPWCVIIDDGMHITPDEDNSRRIAKKIPKEADADLIADAPLLLAEVKRLREEVAHLWKYQGIVEEYDGCFAPEDHTSQWQLLMEAHRGEEE
jgi:hypothetical protein